jgi:endonuclease III related protein
LNNLITLKDLYNSLYSIYGPQGWWPLLDCQENNCNPTNRGLFTGYHMKDYELPSTEGGMFEIMLGAILTQNTSWTNAEKALFELQKHNLLKISNYKDINVENLAEYIRSSGYYNQKAKKILNLIDCLEKNPIDALLKMKILPLREKLLEINGVGPETADSIILYALKKPIFVIDAYTKRILSRLGIIPVKSKYADIQALFHKQIKANLEVYNEYHALFVQHAVNVCKTKPICEKCQYNSECPKIIPPKKKRTKRTQKTKN